MSMKEFLQFEPKIYQGMRYRGNEQVAQIHKDKETERCTAEAALESLRRLDLGLWSWQGSLRGAEEDLGLGYA